MAVAKKFLLLAALSCPLTGAAWAVTAGELASQATSRNPQQATEALYLLGNLGADARYYRASMVPGLMSSQPALRQAAARALKNSGPGAGLAVLPMVRDSASFGRLNATLGFAAMGAEGVPPLRTLLREDPNADVRKFAALSLSKMGDPAIAATPDLQAALEDPISNVRVAAQSALSLLSCARPLLPSLSPPRCFAADW